MAQDDMTGLHYPESIIGEYKTAKEILHQYVKDNPHLPVQLLSYEYEIIDLMQKYYNHKIR